MYAGLLSDCVPPIQTTVAVCAGYGAGGYAAASRLVWISGHSYPISDLKMKGDWVQKMSHATLMSFIFTRRIVNDTYRTDLCLLYPPFMIALGKVHPCMYCLCFWKAQCATFPGISWILWLLLTDTTHTGPCNIVSGSEWGLAALTCSSAPLCSLSGSLSACRMCRPTERRQAVVCWTLCGHGQSKQHCRLCWKGEVWSYRIVFCLHILLRYMRISLKDLEPNGVYNNLCVCCASRSWRLSVSFWSSMTSGRTLMTGRR